MHPPERLDDELTRADFERLLEMTRALAAPFDLRTMLQAVTDAACQVLHAERASVWLLDASAQDLVLEVAQDLTQVRIPVGTGLVGACAREGRTLNVPDCYADPRFDPGTDRRTGFRTRNCLALPLVDHRGERIGVMQVLNHHHGPFSARQVQLAETLAAQGAVALSRVRLADAQREAERLHHELSLARLVQQRTLPATMPTVPGYDLHGLFLPAEETGGDTYDAVLHPNGLLLLLADAAGHGIAPALTVTQMHAMVRMALRLGADLETTFRQVNDALASTLSDGHFVNTFLGLFDPVRHELRYISGGQGPILHFHAAEGRCVRHRANSFPLGAMPIRRPPSVQTLELAPGDVLALITDGLFEYANADQRPFGVDAVESLIARHADGGMSRLSQALLDGARAFAGGSPQGDDVTLLLLQRLRA